MRLWSVHPRYLDSAGLVACWRESLLAQKVLAGETTGYTAHPQLVRFREHPGAIARYLRGLADEADARGYRFRRELIRDDLATKDTGTSGTEYEKRTIPVTAGQLDYEWRWLASKLAVRDPERHARQRGIRPEPHPLFTIVEGGIADWEVVKATP